MVGCGNMGGALLTKWVKGAAQFTVVKPSGKPLPGNDDMSAVSLVQGAEQLAGSQFDVMIIATKPQMIREAIPEYCELLSRDALVVSIAAGFSTVSLQEVVAKRPIVRIMPNMPVAIGEGFSTAFANEATSQADKAFVDDLMAETGSMLWVETEDDLDRATAIAGSGPGYVFEIARSWVDASKAMGFSDDQARAMVLQTLLGAVKSAVADPRPLADLRNNVTSKNGTTAAGLAALNGDSSLDSLFDKTVQAAYDRAVELR